VVYFDDYYGAEEGGDTASAITRDFSQDDEHSQGGRNYEDELGGFEATSYTFLLYDVPTRSSCYLKASRWRRISKRHLFLILSLDPFL
jgi:hypothetical protein